MLDKIIAKVRLQKIIPNIPQGTTLLDLGCGYNGEMLNTIGGYIKSGVGLDLKVNPQKYTTSDKIRLVSGRADHPLPLPDDSFDVVVAMALIEHVEDPETMLREARRVLKPGGVVLLTTPSIFAKWPLEIMARTKLISKAEIDDHKRYYSAKTLSLALQRAKFSKYESSKFGLMWLNLFGKGVK